MTNSFTGNVPVSAGEGLFFLLYISQRGTGSHTGSKMIAACRTILIILLLLRSNAIAQMKCKVEFYSTEHGLSHQAITAIVKDSEGFMWFGSWDGINRFDGHSFLSFKSSAGDFSKLGNDRIDQIVEDQNNHLWIEAYDKQVYRFNKINGDFLPLSTLVDPAGRKKILYRTILSAGNGLVWLLSLEDGLFCVSQTDLSTGNFVNFRESAVEGHRLPSNTLNFFHEDKEGLIWAGTPGGLACISRSAGSSLKNLSSRLVAGSKGISVLGVEEDAENNYFCTDNGQLIVYNKSSKKFAFHQIIKDQLNSLCRSQKSNGIYATSASGDLYFFSKSSQKIAKVGHYAEGSLLSAYEDRSGRLWIETERPGVVMFDPIKKTFRSFTRKVKDPYSSIGNRFKVLEDNNNVIWVNFKGGGFGYYDTTAKNFEYVLNTPDVINYSLPSIVYNIYYDRAGVMWLTTGDRELIKIVSQANNFKQHLIVQPALSRWDNDVRGILLDKRQRLWLGLKSGKLSVRQNDKEVHGLFTNEPPEVFGQIYSMLEDSRGNIWLGTKGNGLYKASPVDAEQTKYRLTHFKANKNDPSALHSNEIYSLLEDRQGRIWIGSFDNGITLARDTNDSLEFLPSEMIYKSLPQTAFRKTRKLVLDKTGKVWVATTDGLLIIHSDNLVKTASYKKVPGNINSLGNNDIQFIHCDSKGRIWLGTAGGGLCLARGSNPFQGLKFQNYTTKQGMPNDYVLSCTEDKSGNLWIATENGLTRFDSRNNTFRNYDSYDGLPKLAFSESSVSAPTPDGRLIFGTTKGYLSFDPAQININRINAAIAFTNLQVNNRDERPGLTESIVEKDINYLSELILKYDQNTISIDYSVPDHRAGNRQVFAYRLLGFDTNWHEDRQQRRATYTNLRSGKYVFEVKSLSTDLYANIPYKRVAINILPPPWKTWWAYCLYAIAFAIFLFFVRRYALAMIRLRNKISVEQKLAALKLNFFTNVSHELRTPLTLIINPLEQIARKANLNPELSSYVEVARKNASRMVHFINQLLDLRKAQSEKASLSIASVEIVSFVKRISEYFTEAAREKKISLEIISEQQSFIARVDSGKLDVVVYNLLGNALKFTPGGKTIKVFIRQTGDKFCISVHDQGPGVPTDKLESIFELFEEGDSSTKTALKGTGIGLALSKEFINLHQGKIKAVNNADGGLTVSVELLTDSAQFTKGNLSFVDSASVLAHPELPEENFVMASDSATIHADEVPLLLLVEDNEDLLLIVSSQLRQFFRVECARNGREGLEMAKRFIPELILSDIMMPEMTGIEMLAQIRSDQNISHIPVVLLSARYSIESQIEGLEYGADYYITKPFNNDFLIASINNLLRQRRKLFESLVAQKKPINLSPAPIIITSKDETFLKDVIKVVEERMGDSEFDVETLATSMFMNQNTFYKKFKSLTGLTIVEFVRDMRLQRARQLLDAGGSNVSEVAWEVGFNNPKYFSTCFKQKYNVTPSEYTKAQVGH